MTVRLPVLRRTTAFWCALLLAVFVGACSKDPPQPPPGAMDADKFLFQRGNESLSQKKWIAAREYFRRLVDTYPRSEFRTQAKLGIGDAFLGEGRLDSYILAANEFREFLQFFPVDPRADYAQYKLAVALSKQVLSPQRDQTATREALVELERFRKVFPDSKYMPDVEKLFRETRDRLSDSEFLVGQFHFRVRLYAGAIARLTELLKDDPGYTRKDQVYHLLGETYYKVALPEQAAPFYEKLLAEYPESRYVVNAKKRLAEIKR